MLTQNDPSPVQIMQGETTTFLVSVTDPSGEPINSSLASYDGSYKIGFSGGTDVFISSTPGDVTFFAPDSDGRNCQVVVDESVTTGVLTFNRGMNGKTSLEMQLSIVFGGNPYTFMVIGVDLIHAMTSS